MGKQYEKTPHDVTSRSGTLIDLWAFRNARNAAFVDAFAFARASPCDMISTSNIVVVASVVALAFAPAHARAAALELTDATFERSIGGKAAFVKFYAPWYATRRRERDATTSRSDFKTSYAHAREVWEETRRTRAMDVWGRSRARGCCAPIATRASERRKTMTRTGEECECVGLTNA